MLEDQRIVLPLDTRVPVLVVRIPHVIEVEKSQQDTALSWGSRKEKINKSKQRLTSNGNYNVLAHFSFVQLLLLYRIFDE